DAARDDVAARAVERRVRAVLGVEALDLLGLGERDVASGLGGRVPVIAIAHDALAGDELRARDRLLRLALVRRDEDRLDPSRHVSKPPCRMRALPCQPDAGHCASGAGSGVSLPVIRSIEIAYTVTPSSRGNVSRGRSHAGSRYLSM